MLYGYASSLYTPQIIFLSNLHGDITEDVVASPVSTRQCPLPSAIVSVYTRLPMRTVLYARHLKINLHCHESQKYSRPMYVEDVCKSLADDTKFT
jgi:hypothetical protein